MYRHFMRQLVLGVLLTLPGLASAQTGTIAGRTVDVDDGAPVPGVNVVLEGTTLGAASDADGRFSFTAPAGDYTLAASFIGYERYTTPVTVRADATTEVLVELEEGGVDLDEIVVTALGIARAERSVGYAVQEVDGDEVARSAESNVVNALAAKTAGVQITSSSGQPGAGSRIVIRGNSSMLGNNQPLFVIDGVPVSNEEDDIPGIPAVFSGGTSNRMLDIDPNVVEEINVLKGASATALYGSRASNGVVLITTKGGGAQRLTQPRVTYTSRVRWDDAVIDGFQDEYVQGENGYFANGLPSSRGGFVEPGAVATDGTPVTNPQQTGSWGPHIDSLNANQGVLETLGVDRVLTYDPRGAFYQTGTVLDNTLSIAGSTPAFNYFLSAGNLRQEGIVRGTDLDRTSVLAKFGSQLTDRFQAGTSVNYVSTNNSWLSEGNGAQTYLYGLNFTPISYDLTNYENEDGSQRFYAPFFNNPIWLSENLDYTSAVDRFIANTRLQYDFTPWLSLTERVGLDTYSDTRKEAVNIGTIGWSNGSMFDQKISRREINSDLTLQATRNLGEAIGLDMLVGNNINHRYYQYNFVDGENLGIPDFYHVSNAATVIGDEYEEERLLVSAFGQLTADYRDYVFLTLTARNDWSSTLPEGENSYFYPSASLGFVFTDALRLFQNGPLSFGKLRASVAQIGSDAPVYSLSTGYLQANPGDGQRGNINFPFRGVNGYRLNWILGNPELKPEISTEYEAGIDLRFFGQRLRLDAAYYDRSTEDQIFEVPVSPATGFQDRLVNAGELRNYGYELTAGLIPIQTADWSWDVQVNWSKNTTEVVALSEGVENIFLFGFTNPQIRVLPGEGGYGVIWGTQYLRTDRDDPDQADLFEANSDLEEGLLLLDDEGMPQTGNVGELGNVQPDWLANLRTGLSYKNLSVGALFDVRKGGDVLNFDLFYSTYYGTAEVTQNRGTTYTYEGINMNTGEPNDVEIVRDQAYYQGAYGASYEPYVEDGSYVKLRELSLSYALPSRLVQRAGFSSASITATGRNLWITSNFSYGDPEGSLAGTGNGQGFYHMVTPGTRSYALTVRFTL